MRVRGRLAAATARAVGRGTWEADVSASRVRITGIRARDASIKHNGEIRSQWRGGAQPLTPKSIVRFQVERSKALRWQFHVISTN